MKHPQHAIAIVQAASRRLTTSDWSRRLRRYALLVPAAAVLAIAAGCGGDGRYTQEEADELVAEAVSAAVDEAQDDFVSEAEAQAKAEAAAKQASLVAAVDGCNLSDSPYVTADEAGLVIEGEGDESRGIDVSEIVCVLQGLDIPDSVVSRISTTTSQMGIVEGKWDVYEAEWTYHPNNGLNIFVVVRD